VWFTPNLRLITQIKSTVYAIKHPVLTAIIFTYDYSFTAYWACTDDGGNYSVLIIALMNYMLALMMVMVMVIIYWYVNLSHLTTIW